MLKQDWPHKWPTFIPDIVAASKTSEPLCENSMVILKLLSEEIFDFSRGELTQVRPCARTRVLLQRFFHPLIVVGRQAYRALKKGWRSLRPLHRRALLRLSAWILSDG